MFWLYIVFGLLIIGLIWLEVHVFLKVFDCFVCHAKKQIPFVPSGKRMRRALVAEIQKHYPQYKTAVDIGAGDCGLARLIARDCNMHVTAIENTALSITLARIKNYIHSAKNVKLVTADAFEYLAKTRKKYDIGIAYLGPSVNGNLINVAGQFRVLITLAVPIPGIKPTRVLKRVGGCTTYGRKWYVNNIYVYETPLKKS